ncbi:MAG: DUF692 family protein [Deltaproteobacteria bacterium]|jgi:hypothetical protein|nr:DUF692 family protein [Deltaproteobacteria bacterium]
MNKKEPVAAEGPKNPAWRPLIGLPVGEFLARPTPELRKLAQMAEILEIKSFPEPAWLPAKKPRVFHWGYGLVEAEFGEQFPALGPKLVDCLAFSCDLGPAASRRQGIIPMAKILGPGELERRIGQSLELTRKHYSGPIGAENYNYYPTGLYERICRPDYLGRLLEKFDLFLVLDLAHAQVSAHNLKTPIRDYLSQFPLGRVAEIHLSRPYLPAQKGAWAVDAHWVPEKPQWNLLQWVLKKIPAQGPALVVVECYHSPQVVLAAYENLKTLLDSLGLRSPNEPQRKSWPGQAR